MKFTLSPVVRASSPNIESGLPQCRLPRYYKDEEKLWEDSFRLPHGGRVGELLEFALEVVMGEFCRTAFFPYVGLVWFWLSVGGCRYALLWFWLVCGLNWKSLCSHSVGVVCSAGFCVVFLRWVLCFTIFILHT